MTSPIDIVLIYGSAREGRLCDKIADWAIAQIQACGGFAVDVIDPLQPDIAAGIDGTGAEARAGLRARLDRAQAFVVVTPEYNHSFPSALKAVIDAGKPEWAAKPVAFVSYGGAAGGIRAVEHLRNVFTELHATSLRDGVAFPNAWNQFDAAGVLRSPEGAEAAMRLMLARLAWWTSALTDARRAKPYAEAVA